MRYGVKEVNKYLDDPWVVKGSGEIEIYYDEDLSVNSKVNKPLRRVSEYKGTRSATDLYASSSSLGLKRTDSNRSRRSSSGTRKTSIKRTSSSSSITGRSA